MNFAYLETARELIGKSDVEALRSLQKPSLFQIKGKDSSKAVLVSVLLHGCEPAGFRAFLKEINSHPLYAYDVYYLIGNVKAAQLEPLFTHRLFPGGDNYNRIWVDPPQTADERLASEIFDFLKQLPLTAHLDLHSFTAKETKPHAFVPNDQEGLNLASKFVSAVFVNGFPFGTLVEKTQLFGPSCVIECGTNNSPEADKFAFETLQKFFYEFKVKSGPVELLSPDVYINMTNIKIKPNVSVSFSDRKQNTELTLREDLDTLNITKLPAGEFLGWSDTVDVFIAKDKTGTIDPGTFLKIAAGKLILARAVVPNLMAPHAERMKESGFYFFQKRNSKKRENNMLCCINSQCTIIT